MASAILGAIGRKTGLLVTYPEIQTPTEKIVKAVLSIYKTAEPNPSNLYNSMNEWREAGSPPRVTPEEVISVIERKVYSILYHLLYDRQRPQEWDQQMLEYDDIYGFEGEVTEDHILLNIEIARDAIKNVIRRQLGVFYSLRADRKIIEVISEVLDEFGKMHMDEMVRLANSSFTNNLISSIRAVEGGKRISRKNRNSKSKRTRRVRR